MLLIKTLGIERLGKSRVNLGGVRRSPISIEKRMSDYDGKMIIIFLYAKVERMTFWVKKSYTREQG